MIRAECEKCGKVVHVPDNFAGGEGKCKRCGWRVYIPRPGERGGAAGSHPAGAGGANELSEMAMASSAPASHGSTRPGAPAGQPGEGRPRTRRRKKDNTVMLVISGILVVLLLVLVGVGIYAARRHQYVKEHPKPIIVPAEPGAMRPTPFPFA